MERKCRSLDIQAMAELAIHHYEHMLDDKEPHLPYFFARLDREESYAWHSEWDFGDACGRFLDALILCGTVLGERKGRQAEEKLKAALRRMQSSDDGLFYRTDNDWGVPAGANMFDQRSAFLGLLSWYLIDRDAEAGERIQRLIEGMSLIGVRKDDYLCYPFENYVPDREATAEIFTEHGFLVDPAHYGGGVFILPLAVYYEHTQDSRAEEMLGMLIRFIVSHSQVFAEDGSFWSRGRYPDDGHFHSKMGTVAGILRFAAAKQDRELIEWCRKVYNWAYSMGGSYGWFPEGTGLNGKEPVDERYRWLPGTIKHSETCCTTDMIHTAIYLAKNVHPSYWDHAEQFANGLAVAQIRDVSWLKASTGKKDTPARTYRDVPARYKGGFTGRMNPNDFTNNGKVDTMACCCAAGGRGLYLLWDHAAEFRDGRSYLHMWFDIDHKTMKADVRLDASGSLTVTPKNDGDLYIRIPGWLDPQNLRVAGEMTEGHGVEGDYLLVRGVKAGQSVRLEFPAAEEERVERIADDAYTLTWLGNHLMRIDPEGSFLPLPGAER